MSENYKTYIVFANYGTEGWSMVGQTDDFKKAVEIREETMGLGTRTVIIVKSVMLVTIEGTYDQNRD